MEVSFEAARRVRQECAQPVIVHFYSWLLQGYRSNAAFTNHAILSFFRRIAEPQQLNLEPMLYQVGACVYVALLCVCVWLWRCQLATDWIPVCLQRWCGCLASRLWLATV